MTSRFFLNDYPTKPHIIYRNEITQNCYPLAPPSKLSSLAGLIENPNGHDCQMPPIIMSSSRRDYTVPFPVRVRSDATRQTMMMAAMRRFASWLVHRRSFCHWQQTHPIQFRNEKKTTKNKISSKRNTAEKRDFILKLIQNQKLFILRRAICARMDCVCEWKLFESSTDQKNELRKVHFVVRQVCEMI